MANITELLAAILAAKKGEQVRGSIHDAIEQCYQDGKAGVNDLEGRRLTEQAMRVNEEQAAAIEALAARLDEIEGGGGGSESQSTTIDVPTITIDFGSVRQDVAANASAQVPITFAETFTEPPAVLCMIEFRSGVNTYYHSLIAAPIKSTVTTTGFTLGIGNKYTAALSPTVFWVAFEKSTVTIDTDITVTDGMSEAEIRAFVAPIQASLDSIKTGYDGTVYTTPGEAVRTQINDLHVLIGHVPGQAIDASAVAYNDTNVGTELTNINGRLSELDETIYKEIVDEKSGTYNATAGTTIPSATHLIDISIPAGTAFKFVLHADGILSKYNLYANGAALRYNLIPETEYDFIAASDITWISVYTTAANVIGSGIMTGVVFVTTVNDGSLQTQVKSMDLESAISMFSISSDDLEDGAIGNGTGEDFSARSRIRTKVYLPVKSGTIISSTFSFNVWEYDFPGKTYIRDGGQWLNSYTVVNDCYIRIMWNSTHNGSVKTAAELLAGTVFSSLTQVGNAFYDTTHANYIEDISSKAIDNLFATAVPSHTVRSIAHRGDDIYGPQCTAPAYILARKRGFTVAENDLWLSEDGEFVMWHDTNLARLGNMVDINGYLMYTDGTDYYWVHPTTNAVYTWNGSDYVASSVALSGLDRCNGTNYGVNSQYSVTGLPLSVLKRIDFGVYKGAKFAGTQILTFAEWVLLCKQLGMEIYVDRKLAYTDTLLTQAANIVKRYGMGDYASWLGLNISQITLLRSIIPDSRCGILRHPTAETAQSYQPYNIGRGFFFNGDAKNGMTAETIQIGLDAGFDVEVWYVDVPSLTAEQVYETIRTAVSYGVTGMTLDHYRVDDAFKSLIDSY